MSEDGIIYTGSELVLFKGKNKQHNGYFLTRTCAAILKMSKVL
jgi:hypothetical protein